MAKFRTKSSVTLGEQELAAGSKVEAHVVSADERTLQVPVGKQGRVEHLSVGDALVTVGDGSQHVVRAADFTAQFEPADSKSKEKEPAAAAKEPAKK
jgi:hypothetical protein